MKLISWNINGIRAAERKGFLSWFEAQSADIVCLQEIKAHPDQLSQNLLERPGYHAHWHAAARKGYSGLCVYSKKEPRAVTYGLGDAQFDAEARVMALTFDDFLLINTYFPHSRRDLSRLEYKMAFNAAFMDYFLKLKASVSVPVIVCGDFNTAHTALDLANDRANRKNAGFLPIEREWLDRFLATGMVDVFRQKHPGEKGHYTWWSQMRGVRERNVGWRIDYHMVDQNLADCVKAVGHQADVLGSDHCPVFIELDK